MMAAVQQLGQVPPVPVLEPREQQVQSVVELRMNLTFQLDERDDKNDFQSNTLNHNNLRLSLVTRG
jgi:hypothetical protein